MTYSVNSSGASKDGNKQHDLYPKPLELQLGGKGAQPHELRLTK